MGKFIGTLFSYDLPIASLRLTLTNYITLQRDFNPTCCYFLGSVPDLGERVEEGISTPVRVPLGEESYKPAHVIRWRIMPTDNCGKTLFLMDLQDHSV